MIKLTAIGNLGRDAVLRQVGEKTAIGFSIAHSEKFKNQEGQEVQKTIWVDCTIWRDKGQSTKMADYLKQGQTVYVEGLPSVNTYTNKDGAVLPQLRLRVDNIQLIGPAKKPDTSGEVKADDTIHSEPLAFTPGSGDDLPF